jgi:hypothetical protein
MSNDAEPIRPQLTADCGYYVVQCQASTGIVIREDGTYGRVAEDLTRYDCGGLKEALDYAAYWTHRYPDRYCVILDRHHRFVQRVWRPDPPAAKETKRPWWRRMWEWSSS